MVLFVALTEYIHYKYCARCNSNNDSFQILIFSRLNQLYAYNNGWQRKIRTNTSRNNATKLCMLPLVSYVIILQRNN